MSENPKAAMVIVIWNKKSYVMELLKSLRNIDYDNHDIIVVDNASTDDTCRTIREQFPHILLIVNSENPAEQVGRTPLDFVR